MKLGVFLKQIAFGKVEKHEIVNDDYSCTISLGVKRLLGGP